MDQRENEEVKKHIDILNVAYHLCIEIVDDTGIEVKAICPFCEYRKNSQKGTLNLNVNKNQYHCFSCGKSGYSIRTICQNTRN